MSNNYTEDKFIDDKKRTLIFILPGGGYEYTSVREGKPIADFFNDLGYHTSVFHYRETKLKYPEIYEEGSRVLNKYHTHPLVKNIIIIGFSAGGHYASYLLTKHKHMFKAGILCYPVISSDKAIRHEGSFKNLLEDINDKSLLESVSTDLLVTEHMPPVFLWHTMEDGAVPFLNSVRFAENMTRHNNKAELHLFTKGGHGLSLITPETTVNGIKSDDYVKQNKAVSIWTTYLKTWLLNLEHIYD